MDSMALLSLYTVLSSAFSSFYLFFLFHFMTRVKLIRTGTGEGPSAAILNTLLSAHPCWVMVGHTWKQLCAVLVHCSSIQNN